MNKKHIIIIAASGILCFTATLAFSWFSQGAYQAQNLDENQQQVAVNIEPAATAFQQATDSSQRIALSENQLKNLLYDAREKITEYDNKLKELELREQRLLQAQQTLNEDIEKLNNLRVDISSSIANLKQQQQILESSRIKIEESEKANLVIIAATYDKMEPEKAGEILINLCAMTKTDGHSAGGIDEAVMILYYMNERKRAKLLDSLVDTKPDLAAVFCEKLKKISETE